MGNNPPVGINEYNTKSAEEKVLETSDLSAVPNIMIAAVLARSAANLQLTDALLLPTDDNFPPAVVQCLSNTPGELQSFVAAHVIRNAATITPGAIYTSAKGENFQAVQGPSGLTFIHQPTNTRIDVSLITSVNGTRTYVTSKPVPNSSRCLPPVPVYQPQPPMRPFPPLRPMPRPKPQPMPVPIPLPPMPKPTTTQSTLDILSADPRFRTLVQLLKLAKLDAHIAQAKNFTLFAPDNLAFTHLSMDTIKYLQSPAGADRLKQILHAHVTVYPTPNELPFPRVVVPSLNTDYSLTLEDQSVNGVSVLDNPVVVNGGKVYPIAYVLIPPTAKGDWYHHDHHHHDHHHHKKH